MSQPRFAPPKGAHGISLKCCLRTKFVLMEMDTGDVVRVPDALFRFVAIAYFMTDDQGIVQEVKRVS